MPRLYCLNLGATLFPSLPSLAPCKNLTWLDLSSNILPSFPEDILQLTSLEYFKFSSRYVSTIEDLSTLKKLKFIHLGQMSNKETVPHGICGMDLEYFYISDTPIVSLPECFGDMKNLSILYLLDTHISLIPSSLWALPNLRLVELANSPFLTDLNMTVAPPALIDLYAVRNRLTSIPSIICEAPNLQVLQLSYNQLASLPDCFGRFPLVRVDFDHNLFTSFPRLNDSLTISSFYENPIKEISNLCILVRLAKLKLVQLDLDTIPDCFSLMRDLTRIWISLPNVKAIPPSLVRDKLSLRMLSVVDTPLTNLPYEAFQDSPLVTLSIHNSQLKTASESLFCLPFLQSLAISGSQLVIIDPIASNDGRCGCTPSPTLSNIDFSFNFLQNLGSSCMRELPSLRSLSVSYNRLLGGVYTDYDVWPQLVTLKLSNNTELEVVNIRSNTLFRVALVNCPSLQALTLSRSDDLDTLRPSVDMFGSGDVSRFYPYIFQIEQPPPNGYPVSGILCYNIALPDSTIGHAHVILNIDPSQYEYKSCVCGLENTYLDVEQGRCLPNPHEGSMIVYPGAQAFFTTVVRPGYYPTSFNYNYICLASVHDSDCEFIRCTYPRACNPNFNANFQCLDGYRFDSLLCSRCSEGYFARNSQCERCPSRPWLLLSLTAGSLFLVFIACKFLFLCFVVPGLSFLLPFPRFLSLSVSLTCSLSHSHALSLSLSLLLSLL